MSLNVQSYLRQIQNALDGINAYRGAVTTVATDSKVSGTNRHRPLLDSIRNDLYHFDEEKKVRIIYNIKKYLNSNSEEDSDLTAVLERILQVVQHFQQVNEVLVSPTKVPHLSQDRTSIVPVSSRVCRNLFDELNALEQ